MAIKEESDTKKLISNQRAKDKNKEESKRSQLIREAVDRSIKEYGETLKKLARDD